MHERIGTLTRNGRTLFYAYVNGQYYESRFVCDVENALRIEQDTETRETADATLAFLRLTSAN